MDEWSLPKSVTDTWCIKKSRCKICLEFSNVLCFTLFYKLKRTFWGLYSECWPCSGLVPRPHSQFSITITGTSEWHQSKLTAYKLYLPVKAPSCSCSSNTPSCLKGRTTRCVPYISMTEQRRSGSARTRGARKYSWLQLCGRKCPKNIKHTKHWHSKSDN